MDASSVNHAMSLAIAMSFCNFSLADSLDMTSLIEADSGKISSDTGQYKKPAIFLKKNNQSVEQGNHAKRSNVKIFVFAKDRHSYSPLPDNISQQSDRSYRNYEKTYSFSTGFRNANFNWTIAGGNNSPNILSELTWEDLRIGVISFDSSILMPNRFLLTGYMTGGYIFTGDNQDSDFFGDNRTMEFSRSNNDVEGDFLFEVGAGVGYKFDMNPEWLPFTLNITPSAGVFYHYFDINMVDGFQTIPASGPFPGLDSHYRTSWYGPYLGFDLESKWQNNLTTFASFKYYWGDYEGVGEWNLRTDFAQPRSFEDLADGEGYRLELGVMKSIRQSLDMSLSFEMEEWETETGIARTFLSNNTMSEQPFNGANWDYWGINAGLTYRF